MTVEQVVESIRKNITLKELQEKETLDYDYVVKNYYPLVMYWLDENGLGATEENIANNKAEISDFVNNNTIDSLTQSLSKEEGKTPSSSKKTNFIPIVLVGIGVVAILYYVSKND